MGETLPNHAYVDLSLVGNDDSGSDMYSVTLTWTHVVVVLKVNTGGNGFLLIVKIVCH